MAVRRRRTVKSSLIIAVKFCNFVGNLLYVFYNKDNCAGDTILLWYPLLVMRVEDGEMNKTAAALVAKHEERYWAFGRVIRH